MGAVFRRTWIRQESERSKMKSFVAIFLFALMAGLRADDFEELLLADDAESDVPDRHPSVVRMGHFCKILY